MSTRASVYLTLSYILCSVLSCEAGSEPACSKFDYEEKLLAKTIRLEVTVEDLVKTVSQVQISNDKCEASRKEMELGLAILRNEFDNQTSSMLELKSKLEEFTSKLNETISKTCPTSYMYNIELNLCWRFYNGMKLNWFDAEKTCRHDRGQLMTLKFSNHITLIQEYLRAAGNNDIVFIGGSDAEHEGTFKWITGENVQNIQWYGSEPNQGRRGNCLIMGGGRWNYKFGDHPCSDKLNFLCEIQLI